MRTRVFGLLICVLVVLALVLAFRSGVFKRNVAQDDVKDTRPLPERLPAEVVKEWPAGHARVGWIRVGQFGVEFFFEETKPEPGDIPGFQVSNTRKLSKVSSPPASFGLYIPHVIWMEDLKELGRLKNLQVLSFSGFHLSDPQLKELTGLQSLQALDLSHTRVTDPGLRKLAGLQSLQALYLGHTNVTDAGLKEIAELNGLQTLALIQTKVTDAGMKELAGLQGLQVLSLGGSKITDAGVKELAKLKKLKTLDVSFTKVTAAGLMELSVLSDLRTLDLERTDVTDSDIARFQAARYEMALPNCKIKR